MRVYFWGTRGSLPASITAETVRRKIIRAIETAGTRSFKDDADIERFVDNELPFTIGRTYGSNTACIELKDGSDYIICDAGTGLRDLGNHHVKLVEQGLKPRSGTVFHIFISHFHWDHIQGFPFFTPAYVPGNQVILYSYHDKIEEHFTRQQNEPYFPVPLAAMSADIRFVTLDPEKPATIGGFTITGIEQQHPGTSYGFRFEKDGKSIVYSSDAEHKTGYDSPAREDNYPFLQFFKDADLLIFDAQYDWNDAIHAKEDWGHSCYVAAVELAVKAKVKHLCLFHNEPTYDDEKLGVLLEDTKNYLNVYNNRQPHSLKIDLAYDGQEIEV